MSTICFLIATILFAVIAFGGTNSHFIPAGLAFTAAGLLLMTVGAPTFTINRHSP
jgi:hypothetical protein